MLYEFEATDGSGDRIELSYPIGKAPKIGAVIRREGREWRRLVPRIAPPAVVKWDVWGWSLPPGLKGVEYVDDGQGGKVARFGSRAEVQKFVDENPGYRYGDGLRRVDSGGE